MGSMKRKKEKEEERIKENKEEKIKTNKINIMEKEKEFSKRIEEEKKKEKEALSLLSLIQQKQINEKINLILFDSILSIENSSAFPGIISAEKNYAAEKKEEEEKEAELEVEKKEEENLFEEKEKIRKEIEEAERRIDEISRELPLLENSKKNAVANKQFKEAARVTSLFKALQLEKE